MSHPIVSVVTPFYNTAEYLAECMDSVLAQDFEDFEYILLDNCSTDGSAEIAADYAERDERIRLLHNDEHLGQVANYNAALRLCSPGARYVKIVQADDWLYPRCLAEMVDAAERHPQCHLVVAHYHWGDKIGGTALDPSRTAFGGSELARNQLLGDAFYFGTPTTVLYRGEEVRSREEFFSLERLHEDTDLCYEIAREHDIAVVHQILTGVRVDEDSITGQVSSFNPRVLDRLIQVETFGPLFLTSAEYDRVRRNAIREYYDALAPRSLRGAEPGFWEYHRNGLSSAGLELNRLELARAIVRSVVSKIVCPADVFRRVTGRSSKGRRNRDGGEPV